MKDEYKISINDLSGALALPLISELFAEYQNVEGLNILLRMLTMLYNNGCCVRAFDSIYTLFRTSGIALPQEFYDRINAEKDKCDFAGEFLADFCEILSELSS
ncbi:hypothetical protein JQM63_09625 [Oscillibacter valericigenes]|nr:hypothetical protein [Oscillibacter valericigenes]